MKLIKILIKISLRRVTNVSLEGDVYKQAGVPSEFWWSLL